MLTILFYITHFCSLVFLPRNLAYSVWPPHTCSMWNLFRLRSTPNRDLFDDLSHKQLTSEKPSSYAPPSPIQWSFTGPCQDFHLTDPWLPSPPQISCGVGATGLGEALLEALASFVEGLSRVVADRLLRSAALGGSSKPHEESASRRFWYFTVLLWSIHRASIHKGSQCIVLVCRRRNFIFWNDNNG